MTVILKYTVLCPGYLRAAHAQKSNNTKTRVREREEQERAGIKVM